jgi:hypothetical protein
MEAKKDGPQLRVESRAVLRTGYPEARNLLPRSSSVGHRKLGVCGAAFGAPASIPRWFAGHLVHQCERCKSAESRINLLHGTSPRYCDVDETRDWSRPLQKESDRFSFWRRQYRNWFVSAQEEDL